jgi:hypothetical protein
MQRHLVTMSLILALGSSCAATDDDLEIGVVVNWRIERVAGGSRSCLEAGGTTVEWSLTRHGEDGWSTRETFVCDEGTASFQVPEGVYAILGELRDRDGLLLAVCAPVHDDPLVLGDQEVEPCVFVVDVP